MGGVLLMVILTAIPDYALPVSAEPYPQFEGQYMPEPSHFMSSE